MTVNELKKQLENFRGDEEVQIEHFVPAYEPSLGEKDELYWATFSKLQLVQSANGKWCVRLR